MSTKFGVLTCYCSFALLKCFVIFAFVVSSYSRQNFGLRHSQPLLFLRMGSTKFSFIQAYKYSYSFALISFGF
jgi:hypothetical protein